MIKKIFLTTLIATLLFGCKSQQLPLSTEETPQHTDVRIEYRDRLTRDTTYVHDSIFIHQKNDTIYFTKWRDRYVERIQIDTCYIQKSDTFKIVKRCYYPTQLTRFEQTKMWIGECTLWLLLVLLLLGVGWGVWKVKKILLA